jgi:hypothetical protein
MRRRQVRPLVSNYFGRKTKVSEEKRWHMAIICFGPLSLASYADGRTEGRANDHFEAVVIHWENLLSRFGLIYDDVRMQSAGRKHQCLSPLWASSSLLLSEAAQMKNVSTIIGGCTLNNEVCAHTVPSDIIESISPCVCVFLVVNVQVMHLWV